MNTIKKFCAVSTLYLISPDKQKIAHLTCCFFFISSPTAVLNFTAMKTLVKIFTRSRRDLAAILAEMREISAAKNAPRSRRDSRRDRSEIWKSRQANTRRDVAARSRRDTEISAAKTRRDREVISRRDMDISAGSFAARPRWESCRDLRRETKFLAVKILLLSRREAKFSAAKLGSMRTIFTFTLTINQTTRR